MYHDGEVAPVGYAGNDRFALDGTRLLLKNGTYGQANCEYALETEDFSHIVSYGTKGDGPESFFVTKKDGTVLQYGHTPDSRFLTNDGDHVMMWLLNKIRDVNGNYIEFIYNNNQSNRTIYLHSIKYTGNDNINQQPYNEIQFSHVVVNEKNRYYEGGYSILNEHILKHVIVKGENGTPVKTYEIMYSNNVTQYYVRDIKESNQTELLNLTSFKYGESSPLFSESATNISLPIQAYFNGHDNTLLLSGNFNGDGKTDFASIKFNISSYSHNGNSKIAKYYKDFTIYNTTTVNNYTQGYSVTLPQNDYYQILGDETTIKNYSFNARDFDGDGLDDVIMSKLDNAHPLNSLQGTDIYYSRQKGTTFSLLSYPPPSNYQRSLSGGEHTFIGDFDGDAKADYINLLNHNTNQNDSKGFLSSPGTNSLNNVISFSEDPFDDNHIPSIWARDLVDADQAHVIDFNGDGKDDIMFIKSTKCCIYTFSKNASGVFIAERLILTNYPTYWHDKLWFGDFNGDKKTDILSKNTNNQWEIAYSNGKNWINHNFYLNFESSCTYNCSGGVHGSSSYVDEIFVADFNGDSKSDILHYKGYCPCRSYKSELHLRLSQYDNITTLWQPITTWNKILSPYAVTIADANGDGRADLLYREVDGNAISAEQISTTYPNLQLISFKPDSKENLLEKVADGFGNVESFDYQPLSSAVNYEKGTTASYPLMDIQAPLYTVQRTYKPDGLGGLTQTKYNYASGVTHLGGRGFLGFKKLIAYNLTTNIKSETITDINTAYYASYVKETKTYHNPNPSTNQQLTHTTNNIDFVQGSVPGTFYQQLLSQTENNLLTGATTTTTNTYDNNNFGTIVSSTTDINGIESITTATTYVQPGYTTIPCMPDLVTVTRTRSGQSAATDKTKFTYDGNGRLSNKTEKFQTIYGVSTTLQYDGFGNITQKEDYNLLTTSPNPNTITTKYGYDAKGRFQISVENDLAQVSTSSWHATWGKPLTVTGIDGVVTTNTYNNWGKLTSTKLKTGTADEETISYSDGWGAGGNTFYTLASHPNKPDVKTWYDRLGREVKTETEHLNGQWTESLKTYDAKGNLATATAPKLSSESTFTSAYAHNDPYNRLTSITNNFGTTNYSYSFLGNGRVKTTVTNPAGQTKSTITDATGKTIEEEDHGGKLYYAYDSRGNLLTVKHGLNILLSHTYNNFGIKTNTYDISAGVTNYTYDAFGRLKSQKDANGHTHTFKYNYLGLVTERTGPEGTTYYSYNETGPGASNQLASVTGFNNINENYLYDNLGRLTHKEKYIDWDIYTTVYTYDANDNISTVNYGNGYELKYQYSNGYLERITRPWGAIGSQTLHRPAFIANSYNGLGQCTQYTLDNSKTTNNTYYHGYFTHTQTPNVQDLTQEYNYATGNLMKREDGIKPFKEFFAYDNLNRLTQSQVYNYMNSSSLPSVDISYDAGGAGTSRGNIISKTDVGSFGMSMQGKTPNSKNELGLISQNTQDITYTPFRKTQTVKEMDPVSGDEYEQKFTYDANYNRVKTEIWNNTQGTYHTRVYLDDYEVNIDPNTGAKTYVHYLSGSDGLFAIAEIPNQYNAGTDNATYHYVYKDHLGSIVVATDASGTIQAEQNFDAWGRERDPATWDYTGATGIGLTHSWLYRGYTGHEHMPHFSIINMNGRMYDPVLGRMMSPDNYLHGGTQGYNRYSYAMNNPLTYVDPDGNEPITMSVGAAIVIGAAISAAAYTVSAAAAPGGLKQNWNFGQFAFNVGMGGIGGALTFGIGSAFGAVGTYGVMGELGRAATHGAAGYITSGGSVSGATVGVVSSGFGSATSGIGLLNTAVGGTVFSAALGAYTAEMTGGEWWQGAAQAMAVHLLNQEAHKLKEIPWYEKIDWFEALGNTVDGAFIGFDIATVPSGEAIPLIAGRKALWSAIQASKNYGKIAIQFGKTENQIYHAFRHTDALGLDRKVVTSAITKHFNKVHGQVVSGKPFNQIITVAGQKIQYTAYKLSNGTFNIGRIHGVK